MERLKKANGVAYIKFKLTAYFLLNRQD